MMFVRQRGSSFVVVVAAARTIGGTSSRSATTIGRRSHSSTTALFQESQDSLLPGSIKLSSTLSSSAPSHYHLNHHRLGISPNTVKNNHCHRHFSSSSNSNDHASLKTTTTNKDVVIQKWDGLHKKYFMNDNEYAGIVVGKESTNGEYVITDGIIGPGGFVPDHYHRWEDQTFHVIQGELQVKIGVDGDMTTCGVGDTIHCPRGVSHYMKNVGTTDAKVISYIFPGYWAEDFMAETSRQNHSGKGMDFDYIAEKFGVVYV